jgi:hypothetical protein
MYSAKAIMSSVKPLSSAALGKEPPAKNASAKNSLPSAFYWAECKLGSRQRKVTVTALAPSAHAFPSAMSEALDKDFFS